MALPQIVREWFIPVDHGELTLKEAMIKMKAIALDQESIPLIVQLVENPKWDIPGIEIFDGSTDLETHDFIHLLIGRGVLPKDEAFVLGFTMGSSNRISTLDEKLYGLMTRYLYPKHYRFSEEDFQVYRDAVRLGYISDCKPLNKVNYPELLDLTLDEAREKIGIEADLLKAYYAIEAKRYPDSFESQRLVKRFHPDNI